MRFAHMADCHLGGWREPKLRELGMEAFLKAVALSISRKVDFVLIAGDLFNTSLPSIEAVKVAVTGLKRLKKADIPVYAIAGSHDFSPSGKAMLDVLEEAELLVDVCRGEVHDNSLKLKFIVDPRTGAKITGMLGRKGVLEKHYYEKLSKENLESEPGFKIFMFHSAITEMKPAELEKMESAPVSFLPKGFDYYAGGHVHIIAEASLDGYRRLIYPGPVFPNSFSELEKLGNGGICIFENAKATYNQIEVCGVARIELDCAGKTPEEVTCALVKEAEKIESDPSKRTIVMIKLAGKLFSGKLSSIDFKEVFSILYDKGAFFVMKNTAQISSKEFDDMNVASASVEDIEAAVLEGQKENLAVVVGAQADSRKLLRDMLMMLSKEKGEGEKSGDFERRVTEEMDALLKDVL